MSGVRREAIYKAKDNWATNQADTTEQHTDSEFRDTTTDTEEPKNVSSVTDTREQKHNWRKVDRMARKQ